MLSCEASHEHVDLVAFELVFEDLRLYLLSKFKFGEFEFQIELESALLDQGDDMLACLFFAVVVDYYISIYKFRNQTLTYYKDGNLICRYWRSNI